MVPFGTPRILSVCQPRGQPSNSTVLRHAAVHRHGVAVNASHLPSAGGGSPAGERDPTLTDTTRLALTVIRLSNTKRLPSGSRDVLSPSILSTEISIPCPIG